MPQLLKATAWAPVNLALIKYWGKTDSRLRLPANSSLSINLSSLGTKTTVDFNQQNKEDLLVIDNKKIEGKSKERVEEHLNRIRQMANVNFKAKVVSENNFAMGVGLSSSASGMAALSLAASQALGLNFNKKDLSRLARIASGSACRSIPDGWVEWVKGDNDSNSYAKTIFKANHWDLRILVVLLSQKEKRVSSTDGQAIASTSPFFKTRIKEIETKIRKIKKLIKKKDFTGLGRLMEDEALNMHAVMLTSQPHLVYWLPETIRVIRAVEDWRDKGLESYFTINTGQNVFVICQAKDEDRLVKKIKNLEGVIEVRRDRIGGGARIISQNFFFVV